MESTSLGNDIFVRLDPGDRLMECLTTVAEQHKFSAAAIVSGVGMLSSIELGFFDAGSDEYKHSGFQGIYDLSMVLGNIFRRDREYSPHVHVVFNDPSHRTYSGHVIEATCHITMELFLSTSALALKRVKVPGCPATKVVGDV